MPNHSITLHRYKRVTFGKRLRGKFRNGGSISNSTDRMSTDEGIRDIRLDMAGPQRLKSRSCRWLIWPPDAQNEPVVTRDEERFIPVA